jgi:hypothetical protein
MVVPGTFTQAIQHAFRTDEEQQPLLRPLPAAQRPCPDRCWRCISRPCTAALTTYFATSVTMMILFNKYAPTEHHVADDNIYQREVTRHMLGTAATLLPFITAGLAFACCHFQPRARMRDAREPRDMLQV